MAAFPVSSGKRKPDNKPDKIKPANKGRLFCFQLKNKLIMASQNTAKPIA